MRFHVSSMKIIKKIGLGACMVLFSMADLHAQDSEEVPANPWAVTGAFHYGFIIPHTESLEAVSGSNPIGLQVDVFRHLNTQSVWDQCNCYPRVGLSTTIFHYNNPEVLGNSYNFLGFIEPFMTFKGNLNFSFRMAFGVSLLDQVYDEVTNPMNLFYSSPVSFILQAGTALHYKLDDRWNLRLGAQFGHISNGGISKPNKGMNFPTISLGAEYKLQPVVLKDRQSMKSIEEIHPKKWVHRLTFFNGMKEADEDEKKYHAFGLVATSSWVVSKINALSAGVEWISDGSIRERSRRAGEKVGNANAVALITGNELLLGRFIFSQQMAVYFNKPFPNGDRFYHRWGLTYSLGKTFFGVNLKAHRHIADLLDFRVGVSL